MALINKEEIIKAIRKQLWSDFVIGRNDEGKIPWSDKKINSYLKENEKQINLIADEVMTDKIIVEPSILREYIYANLEPYSGIHDEEDSVEDCNITARQLKSDAIINNTFE